jgi:hypothetical protein
MSRPSTPSSGARAAVVAVGKIDTVGGPWGIRVMQAELGWRCKGHLESSGIGVLGQYPRVRSVVCLKVMTVCRKAVTGCAF